MAAPQQIANGPRADSYEIYEDLNARFSSEAMVPALDATTGARAVMGGFNQWFWNQPSYSRIDVAIPPRAEDCLVFPTLHHLFEAINNLLRERGAPPVNHAELMGSYGFGRVMLAQPVNTFSTGEKILSVIARARALAPIADSLIVVNPCNNLFSERRHHLVDLIEDYKSREIPVRLLELSGGTANANTFFQQVGTLNRTTAKPLQLSVADVSVVFPEVYYPLYVPARRLRFRSGSGVLEMLSPCLITGQNGVGKTTLMKALCELIPIAGGHLNLATSKYRHSRPRLLFNETESQMFAIRPMEHIGAVFTFDKKKREEAVRLFDELQSRFSANCARCGIRPALQSDASPTGYLQSKLALIAERVTAYAGSIVLDEPTTGLNVEQGAILLHTIAGLCGEREIGMLVVSHEEYRGTRLFQSHLHLSRSTDGAVEVSVKEVL